MEHSPRHFHRAPPVHWLPNTPVFRGLIRLFQIQQDDMEAAGMNMVAEVSSTSPLGSTPGVATMWHDLTPVSTVQIGEQ